MSRFTKLNIVCGYTLRDQKAIRSMNELCLCFDDVDDIIRFGFMLEKERTCIFIRGSYAVVATKDPRNILTIFRKTVDVCGYRLGLHAEKRLKDRGFSLEDVKKTIQKGTYEPSLKKSDKTAFVFIHDYIGVVVNDLSKTIITVISVARKE